MRKNDWSKECHVGLLDHTHPCKFSVEYVPTA